MVVGAIRVQGTHLDTENPSLSLAFRGLIQDRLMKITIRAESKTRIIETLGILLRNQ